MPYKKKIIKLLIDNPDIVRTIDVTKVDNPSDLIWKNILPIHRVPKTSDGEAKIYITIDMFAPKISDNLYKEVIIAFNIFAHDNKQQTTDQYCVVDYLQSKVDEMFNCNGSFGIGLLEVKANQLLTVNEDYYGTTTVYSVTNFNDIKHMYA